MASANVVDFTADSWEAEVVNSPIPVLVDFWAVWCAPCRAMMPTINKLADQYKGKVKVGKLNMDDHPDVAVRYGISAIPQVLFFKGSDQPVDKTVGIRSEAEFTKILNRILESETPSEGLPQPTQG